MPSKKLATQDRQYRMMPQELNSILLRLPIKTSIFDLYLLPKSILNLLHQTTRFSTTFLASSFRSKEIQLTKTSLWFRVPIFQLRLETSMPLQTQHFTWNRREANSLLMDLLCLFQLHFQPLAELVTT